MVVKHLGRIIGVIAVVAFWQLGLPLLISSGEVASGTQWDDAVEELRSSWITETKLTMNTNGIEFQSSVLDATGACFADGIAEFLNTTDCKYKYVESVSSQAEHLAEQEACFQKVGFEARRDSVELKCIQKHFPKEWAPYKAAFIEGWTTTLIDDSSVEKEKAGLVATCIVERLLQILTEVGCDPVDRQTEDAGAWVALPDTCLATKPESKAKFEEAQSRCAAANGLSFGAPE